MAPLSSTSVSSRAPLASKVSTVTASSAAPLSQQSYTLPHVWLVRHGSLAGTPRKQSVVRTSTRFSLGPLWTYPTDREEECVPSSRARLLQALACEAQLASDLDTASNRPGPSLKSTAELEPARTGQRRQCAPSPVCSRT